jgi:dihydroorotase
VRHVRVIDPARNIDAQRDVVVEDGRIHALVEPAEEYTCPEIDASGKLVVPGLVDLHTHVYWGGSSISIRLEDHLIRSGATTWVDAGSAGAGNFKAFKQYIVDSSPVRIMAFLNISFAGIFGCMNLESGDFESGWVGELCDLRLANISEAVSMHETYPETIADITVLDQESGRFAFQDCFGNVRRSDTRLKPTDLIFSGKVMCRSGSSPIRPLN